MFSIFKILTCLKLNESSVSVTNIHVLNEFDQFWQNFPLATTLATMVAIWNFSNFQEFRKRAEDKCFTNISCFTGCQLGCGSFAEKMSWQVSLLYFVGSLRLLSVITRTFIAARSHWIYRASFSLYMFSRNLHVQAHSWSKGIILQHRLVTDCRI